ncbi:hypothetical protein BDY21DRAFT_365002 [Lineolata rhizophorae]|uniref:Serine/threonine-protein kinase ppk6 n=1 Tax=Lineolata rhizophorae TaxID=578093 RepID=A0A6A6NVC6_9PEZI|nr:hypothetical protein BDY21DRAFT_365002 [Lineolata rhizophorae]
MAFPGPCSGVVRPFTCVDALGSATPHFRLSRSRTSYGKVSTAIRLRSLIFRNAHRHASNVMSLDLLAEFGSPTGDSQATSKPENKPAVPTSGPNQAAGYSFFDDIAPLDSGFKHPVNDSASSGKVPAFQTSQATHSGTPTAVLQQPSTSAADDDWGDFEDATPSAGYPQPAAANSGNDLLGGFQSSNTLDYAKQPAVAPSGGLPQTPPKDFFDLLGDSAGPRAIQHAPREPAPPRPKPTGPPRDPNVLFDAEDLDEEDEFGEFEGDEWVQHEDPLGTVEPQKALGQMSLGTDQSSQNPREASKPSQPQNDLLDLLSPAESAPAEPAPISTQSEASATSRRKAPRLVQSFAQKTQTARQSPAAKKQEEEEEEEWPDFPDDQAPSGNTNDKSPLSALSTSVIGFSSSTENDTTDVPPTNIPPPALILGLFPSLLNSAQRALFEPLSSASPDTKSAILSSSITHDFLRAYLALGTVVGRVIAGRKMRWKRDSHLAQGMRIGPAASGGRVGAGMKLTGVDRAESTREQTEVLDVLRVWKTQVGKLRSAVAGASNAGATHLGHVPELRETMPVKRATQQEGGLTAPRPCALCGLRREERVDKVDFDVQDNFGEWWIERTSMHRACKNFWNGNREKLRQR